MRKLPPGILIWFFRLYCNPKIAKHIEGDLIEVYRRRLADGSKRKADFRFLVDIILLFRPDIIRRFRFSHLNRIGMFKNYLTITLRVFNKERLYSLINVSGLAVGFSCCLLIYLFISDELSYDKFHVNGDRIYRIGGAYMRQGQWEPYSTNSWRTADIIKTNYSEVELLTRVMPDNNTLFEHGDKKIVENRFAWVDGNFFEMFNFPLVAGNPAEALKGPNKVVISRSIAAKYFGNEDPLGKAFRLSDYPIDLQVSGLIDDMPSNSHFHFDMLISGETLRQVAPEQMFTNVGWDSQYLYARLAPDADPARIESTFPDFIDKNMDFWKSTTFKLFLQPVESIHLQSNIGTEIEANGSLTRIYTFSVIAVFILVIACVNYMNLTTARSMRRAKEVGMRKVMGANRRDLLGQFLTESFIMTATAVLLAIGICLLVLPSFNDFAGKQISRDILFGAPILSGLVVSLVVIAVVAGLYPAMMLSSFRPLNGIKLNSGTGGKTSLVFRKGLVLLQFVISIGLISASAIVYKQWTFMKNKELGFNDDAILRVPLETMDRAKISVFATELLTNSSIMKAGFSNMRMPGWIGNSTSYRAQDVNADDEVNKSMKLVRIDYDFMETIEGQIIDGRNFSREFPSDTISSLILNESAVAQLKWTDPVGKWIEFGDRRFDVVGVVKDFHFESVHRKIPPTIFVFSPRSLNFIYLKVETGNMSETLAHIEKTYSRYVTNRDFSFTFLNDEIEKQYSSERKFTEVFTLFTSLAILIACLGTFGLISFSAERKAKEIGIRKVLGASVGNVSLLLIREFIILLLIASVFAWPVTYYFLSGWVNAFIYHTSIGLMPFLIATAMAAVIVVMTTGFRALKAALANPVDSLRE